MFSFTPVWLQSSSGGSCHGGRAASVVVVLAPGSRSGPPDLVAFVSAKVTESQTTETMHTLEGVMLLFLVLLARWKSAPGNPFVVLLRRDFICCGHSQIPQYPGR